ncbi:hypothetical protein IID21_02125 [Patescibacteria group bacterium]|nr:hypothetical protein [Patescibacteria group bacterium]
MERNSGNSIRLKTIYGAYQRGLRCDNLERQPAQWVVSGLERLEGGGRLTVEDLDKIDRMGGTDHPDPWFT